MLITLASFDGIWSDQISTLTGRANYREK